MRILLIFLVSLYGFSSSWKELTKYVVIPQTLTNLEGDGLANDACKSQYGTSLASIHNDDDNIKAQQICQVQVGSVTDSGCMIGLTDFVSEGTWKWIDGTPFNYGSTLGTTPWASGEPGTSGEYRDCAILGSGDNYTWKDKSCEKSIYYTLCNKQSELCYSDNWSTHPHWIWSNDNWNCHLTNNNDGFSVDNIILDIASNQWKYIALDYMFKITPASAPTGNAGIILNMVDFDNIDTIYRFYIGLAVKDGDSNIYLLYQYVTGGLSQEFVVSTFDVTSYYELRFEFQDGVFTIITPKNVIINTKSLFPSKYYVDSIEIQNKYLSTISKYLFINGLKIETNASTMYPSQQPTQQPTNKPITLQPTKQPTATTTTTTTTTTVITTTDTVTSRQPITTTTTSTDTVTSGQPIITTPTTTSTSSSTLYSTGSEMIGITLPTISPTEGADGAVNDNTVTTIYFEGNKNDTMNDEDGIDITIVVIIGCIGCFMLLLVICIIMKCKKRRRKQKQHDMNEMERSIAQQNLESTNNIQNKLENKLENILVIDGKQINEAPQHIIAGGNDTMSEDEGSDDIDTGSGDIATGIVINGETNSDEYVVDGDDTDEVTPNGGIVDEFIVNNDIVTVHGQNDDEIVIADINDGDNAEFVIEDDTVTSNGGINTINGDVELQEIDTEQHIHFTNEGDHDIANVIFVKNTQNDFQQNLVHNALGNNLLMDDIVEAINDNDTVTKR